MKSISWELLNSGWRDISSKAAVSKNLSMPYMNQGRSASLHNVQFSKREKQVLQELAAGRMNRDIGANLFISESTVKFHVHAILTKLGASNRTEAVSMAHKFGFIEFSGNAGDSN